MRTNYTRQFPQGENNWLYKNENGEILFAREVQYKVGHGTAWEECTTLTKDQYENLTQLINNKESMLQELDKQADDYVKQQEVLLVEIDQLKAERERIL